MYTVYPNSCIIQLNIIPVYRNKWMIYTNNDFKKDIFKYVQIKCTKATPLSKQIN